MSLEVKKPLASIVLGVNPEHFDVNRPKDDHFLFLIKDILVRDFPNYLVNCYFDSKQKSKYFIDIHNAHKHLEAPVFRDTEYPLSKIYFPELESRIFESLEDFEIRLPKNLYENFLPKLGVFLNENEIATIVGNSISYCHKQKEAQKKVALFNKLLASHPCDFSGYSFYLNYSEPHEIHFIDFRNNILGVFDTEVNISLIELWINTMGDIKVNAKKFGYEFLTTQESVNKNPFGSFIIPNVSDDLFTDTDKYKDLLDKTDSILTSNNTFNEIKFITRSTFIFFRTCFKDGMAERCYDLNYNEA